MTENIVLIGFMGSGKTTVGKSLAKKLGLEFIDIDSEIEKKEKMSIPMIFDKYGEKYFRELETNLLHNLINKRGIILSTGGGIIEKEENHKLLKQIGHVVWLNPSVRTIVKNLDNKIEISKRPLLKDKKNLEEIIKNLLNKRYEKYKYACDFEINVDNKNIDMVTSQILVKFT